MQDYKSSGKCLLDEDLNEIKAGKRKTISLAEARKIYGNRKWH